MKRLFFITLVVALAATAYAFSPKTIASESKTKGTTTVSTQYADQLMFRSSATASVTINGTGSSYPVAANTDYIWGIDPSTTSLVFARTSSATPTVIYSVR